VGTGTTVSDFNDKIIAILNFDLATDANGAEVLRATAVYPESDRDYFTVLSADWTGRAPILLSGGNNGTFSAGALDPATGLWLVDAADIDTLQFTPDLHFTGVVPVQITHGADIDLFDIEVTQVADAPTVTTADVTATQSTAQDISGSIVTALVDMDGSEIISAIELTVTAGHTITDGVNTFVAAAGADTVDISTWDLSSLEYIGPVAGVFPVGVRVETTDQDNFTTGNSIAETNDTFNVTILADFDADGIPDVDDLDDDNDGIPDTVEGTADTDGDGIPDSMDPDSDNDGIPDAIEAGGIDADGDGVIDGFTDLDGDGLDDATATTPLPVDDTDGDGLPDYLDLDSDNDGLTDASEAGGVDADGDGIIDGFTDADGDGLDDATATTPIVISDIDGDGTPDHLDTDSDGDGIPDVVEAGGTDADGDGMVDGFTDADNDGIDDNATPPVGDFDGDGIPDHEDFDSDNDGIPDSVEAANGIVDTDGDGQPDHLDLDSDGDGLADVLEAGGTDADGDGVIDGFTDLDGDGMDDATEAAALPVDDFDGDGIPDYLDEDSDNDGIPDSVEAANGPVDTDGDGQFDHLDADAQTVMASLTIWILIQTTMVLLTT